MSRKRKFLVGILIFCVSYPAFLYLWIQVKPYYGSVISRLGGDLAAWSMGAELEEIKPGDEAFILSFVRPVFTTSGLDDLVLDLKLSVSAYSFNVPLTFALIIGLLPVFRWRKLSYLEAGIILVAIHVLFVYSFCLLKLYQILVSGGFIMNSVIKQYLLEFMWAFTDNLVIRFEPFLLAVYLWLRNMDNYSAIFRKETQT